MIRRLVTYNFACIVFLGDITYNGGEECPSSAARLSTLLEDTSFFPFLFSQASLTCITSRLPSIMPNHRSPQQSKTKTHNTPVAPSLYWNRTDCSEISTRNHGRQLYFSTIDLAKTASSSAGRCWLCPWLDPSPGTPRDCHLRWNSASKPSSE